MEDWKVHGIDEGKIVVESRFLYLAEKKVYRLGTDYHSDYSLSTQVIRKGKNE